jgi:transcriptional regulator with XRE-family HTH domain
VKASTEYITPGDRRKRVMKVLKLRGWTRYKLAQIIGVQFEQVEGYMKSRNPQLDTLKKLASALGVPITFLILKDYRKESK